MTGRCTILRNIERYRHRKLVPAVVLLTIFSLAFRISSADDNRPLGGDELEYHALAVRLAEGKGFVTDTGQPTAYRTPGFPLLNTFASHGIMGASSAG